MFKTKSTADVISALNSDAVKGLTSKEAALRLAKNGPNALKEGRSKTYPEMFLSQLNEPLIYVLIAAAIISAILGELSDTGIIVAVILINAFVGVIQEGKAIKALEALKRLTDSGHTALVRRDGTIMEAKALELVPGDIVILEAGRQVPADIRLISTFGSLKTDEASLTGESVPVEKNADYIAGPKSTIGDTLNMAYMSTNVVYGHGEGIVTATGMDTEIGKIADSINNTSNEATPLQKRLGELGRLLSILAIILCILLFIIAILQKRNIFEMFLTAISLAVAAVPEGLPAVVTIVLALSVSRMVKVNTIVRRLPSVETLGCVNIVCSDKTGTLTLNKMSVTKCFANNKEFPVHKLSDPCFNTFITGFLLCNDATFTADNESQNEALGDPTETALLEMAKYRHLNHAEVIRTYPRTGEIPFDSERKLMTTFHKGPNGTIQFTKGSVENILNCCTMQDISGKITLLTPEDKKRINDKASKMSSEALRTLGLAYKKDLAVPSEKELIFLGFAGMTDPVREEAKAAINTFKAAGVKTVMITGDHKNTALAIAKELGIAENLSACLSGEMLSDMSDTELNNRIEDISVFARVSPEHKTRIVRAYKARGNIVAMTGDGTNDAPSLRAADIGIAMGRYGTDVAKDAADIILADDNFATIEKAIEEGRGIYANIKKSVLFLLSSNFGEIITMFLSVLMWLPAPLKPSHILWVNLITDTLPALALGTDKNDAGQLMSEPPRPAKESLFAHGGLCLTLFYGILIAGISLAAFITLPCCIIHNTPTLSLNADTLQMLLAHPVLLTRCQTYAFSVLGISQLFHSIGMRNTKSSVIENLKNHNPMIWISLITGLSMQLIITEIPYLTQLFGTALLSFNEWMYLLFLSLAPLAVHELLVIARHIFAAKK